MDPEEVPNRGPLGAAILSAAIQWIILAIGACLIVWFLPIPREWRVGIIIAILAAVVLKVTDLLSQPFGRFNSAVFHGLKRPLVVFSLVLRPLKSAILWWWKTFNRNPALAVIIAVIVAGVGAGGVAGILRLAKPQSVLVVTPFEIPPPPSGAFVVTGRRLSKMMVDQLDMVMQEGSDSRVPSSSTGGLLIDLIDRIQGTRGGVSRPLILIPPSESSPAERKDILGVPLDLLIGLWRTIRYQRVYIISGDVAFGPGEMSLSANSGSRNAWNVGPFPNNEVGLKGACYQLALEILSDMNTDIVGQFYLGRRDYEKAIAQFRKALERKPDDPDVLNKLGGALYLKGQVEEAIESYRKAIALKSNFPEALNNLGVALYVKGKIDEAIDNYRKAIALKSDFPEVFNNLGAALPDGDEAIAAYGEALKLKPDCPEALNNLGLVLANNLDKLDEAMAYFQRALVLVPNFPEALNNLGFAFNKKELYDDAIIQLKKALEVRPDYPEALNNLGFAFNRKERYDDATVVLRKAVTLKPNYHAPYRHLGDALAAKDQIDEAIASYSKALECKHDYAQAHYGLAKALRRKAEGERNPAVAVRYIAQAELHFAEAEKLDPKLKPPKQ